MKRCWLVFLVGCFLGCWIPFIIDQSLAYQDEFGVTNLSLGERVTLVSLSPNESMRVLLVERGFPSYGERNFYLRLQKKGEQNIKTIFTSFDEETPAGSERIVWTADSSKFILLSRKRKLSASADINSFMLKNGEKLSLLYDARTAKVHCRQVWEPGEFECLVIPKDTLMMFQQQGLL